jgi:hypothetical protein
LKAPSSQKSAQLLQRRTGQGYVVVGQLVNGAQKRKSVIALSFRMKDATVLHAADAGIARRPLQQADTADLT